MLPVVWWIAAGRLVRRAGAYKPVRQASTAQTTPLDLDAIYSLDRAPPHYCTPAASVQHIPGKGRALLATAPLKLGDTIMLTQPLAVLHGPADDMPPPDGLLPLLRRVCHAHGQEWLQLLYRGPEHGKVAPTPEQGAAQLEALQRLLHHPVQGGDGASGGVGQQQHTAQGAAHEAAVGLHEEDLEEVITYNAFGDAFEDLAAFECRSSRRSTSTTSTNTSEPGGITEDADSRQSYQSAEAQSHVGVWPHFSLLNHSCVPKCVHYVVGSTMVVRAVQDIEPGEELTISYLGREDFSPGSVRQELLHSRYGFQCDCARCRLESALPPSISQVLSALHQDVKMSLGPALVRAAEQDDRKALAQVGSSLVEWSARLHDALTAFKQQATPDLLHPPPPPSADTHASPAQQATEPQSTQQPQQGSSQLQPQQGGSQQPLTLAAFASSPDQPQPGAAVDEQLQRLHQAVEEVGGVDAAVLCLEASVYDFIELLHQHAQLSACYAEEGEEETSTGDAGEEAAGAGAVGQAQGAAVGKAGVRIAPGQPVEEQQGREGMDAYGDDPLGALRLSADILHAVSRGSELHVFQTSRLLDLALTSGAAQLLGERAAVPAAQAAEEALLCRYGPVTPNMMAELARYNARISEQFLV